MWEWTGWYGVFYRSMLCLLSTANRVNINISSSCLCSYIYATPAAGGIIYSLRVFFLFFFGKAVRTHYCKYLYSVKSGWSKITSRLTQNIYLKFLYSRITLYLPILEGIFKKKSENLPTLDESYHMADLPEPQQGTAAWSQYCWLFKSLRARWFKF